MSRETTDLTEDPRHNLVIPEPELREDLEDLALGDDYALNPEYVEMVIDAADRGDTARLRELVHARRQALRHRRGDQRDPAVPDRTGAGGGLMLAPT